MIYRKYGKTGKDVSVLGFGGMRFGDIDDAEKSVSLMVQAAEGGVNYFDTAPKYFGTKSEEVFGRGLAELRARNLPYYLSTKTFCSKEYDIRMEIEGQLKRLDVDAIDFYHVWCVTSLDDWRRRKKNEVINTFRALKDEGLIRHICVSSHLIGDEIKELLMEGVFEGVLFGYSAYNFATRQAAFDAIRSENLGCVIMNPLGGGLIPSNPEVFDFIRSRDDETVVQAALRFLIAHEDISTALVGFSDSRQVSEALSAVEGYKPLSEFRIEEMKSHASSSLDGICTGCQYCDKCPQGIPIPRFMETYNQKILGNGEDDVNRRMTMHWGITPEQAEECIGCGICEEACTQHLPIIERLEEISRIKLKGVNL